MADQSAPGPDQPRKDGAADAPLTFAEISREEHLLRTLNEDVAYSSNLLTECYRMLTAIRRVDQKYGPYPDFAPWREANAT